MDNDSQKTDKRIVRSKLALKSALLELMKKKSFASITTTEIVKHADFNRGTFYAHYEHKEALLEDIMHDLLEGLSEAFRKPYEKIDSFEIASLPATAVALFDHIYAHAETYSLMVDERVMPGFREKMFNTLKNTSLNDLIHQANMPEKNIDIELFVIYQMHALLGLACHWIQSGFQHPPKYMAEQLVHILQARPNKVVTKKSLNR
ncbi:TetR/AcrR family transcriptional regulator [Paenibacillus sp. NEAU-GSW1]|uniref:TetR/AcrR family transcriptional regulator n=1 Tax=Paenibacillus sp. NEAU-GSW1 TaxID=2682486 RepID=UPI0012E0CF93|nr:TetR/AcrR family transcriptional regulator [Paenibacillus sp. NEAU-GSW1]MUT66951.1 TetR family transcriptional regulator [Paenibacillus sp. NEAU-GSW1]